MTKQSGTRPSTRAARPAPRDNARLAARLIADRRGAVLIEMAFSFPILIILLIGILSYGSWLMVAHTVQQAANEAARAAIAGISNSERQTLANESVSESIGGANFLDPDLITVTTSQSGNFYSVAVSYDARQSRLFSASPVPLPSSVIRRAAVVKLGAL